MLFTVAETAILGGSIRPRDAAGPETGGKPAEEGALKRQEFRKRSVAGAKIRLAKAAGPGGKGLAADRGRRPKRVV